MHFEGLQTPDRVKGLLWPQLNLSVSEWRTEHEIQWHLILGGNRIPVALDFGCQWNSGDSGIRVTMDFGWQWILGDSGFLGDSGIWVTMECAYRWNYGCNSTALLGWGTVSQGGPRIYVCHMYVLNTRFMHPKHQTVWLFFICVDIEMLEWHVNCEITETQTSVTNNYGVSNTSMKYLHVWDACNSQASVVYLLIAPGTSP